MKQPASCFPREYRQQIDLVAMETDIRVLRVVFAYLQASGVSPMWALTPLTATLPIHLLKVSYLTSFVYAKRKWKVWKGRCQENGDKNKDVYLS